MQKIAAGALGGLIGAGVLSLAMDGGRRAGVLHKTLAEHAEDWLDRTLNTRRRIGDRGTTLVELANHLGAGAAFGAAYGVSREQIPAVADAAAGAVLGAVLYLVNIVEIAPMIGLTRGEWKEPPGVAVQRLTMRVLFRVTTGLVTAALMKQAPVQ